MKRFYVDTNIFDYVALRHPKYGEACKRITDDIRDGKIEAHCSFLVPVEILGSLAQVDPQISAGAVAAFFAFPIKLIPLDERLLSDASRMMLESGVGYDSIHAAAMKRAGLKTVLTEDVDHWGKFREIKIVRPTEYGGERA